MPETSSPKMPRSQQFWRLAFVFALLLALTSLGVYLFSPDWIRLERDLPVGIQSPLRADYSADPLHFSVQPLGKNLYVDVFNDQPPMTQAALDPLATLEARLRTPVPTITQAAPLTPRVVFTRTPTRAGRTETATPVAPPTRTQPVAPPATLRGKPGPTATPPETRPTPTRAATPVPPAVDTPAPTDAPTPTTRPTLPPAPTALPAPTETPGSAYPPPGTGSAKAK